MKRFLLFSYAAYYPSGGWSDLYDSYDTLEEARAAFVAAASNNDHQIVDTETGEVYQ